MAGPSEKGTFIQVPNVVFQTCKISDEALVLLERIIYLFQFKSKGPIIGSYRKLETPLRAKRDKLHRNIPLLGNMRLIDIQTNEALGFMSIIPRLDDLWELNGYWYMGFEIPEWDNLETVLIGVRKIGQSNDKQVSEKSDRVSDNPDKLSEKPDRASQKSDEVSDSSRLKSPPKSNKNIKNKEEDKNAAPASPPTHTPALEQQEDVAVSGTRDKEDQFICEQPTEKEELLSYRQASAITSSQEDGGVGNPEEKKGRGRAGNSAEEKPKSRKSSKKAKGEAEEDLRRPELPELSATPTADLILQIGDYYRRSRLPETERANSNYQKAKAAAKQLMQGGWTLAQINTVMCLLTGDDTLRAEQGRAYLKDTGYAGKYELDLWNVPSKMANKLILAEELARKGEQEELAKRQGYRGDPRHNNVTASHAPQPEGPFFSEFDAHRLAKSVQAHSTPDIQFETKPVEWVDGYTLDIVVKSRFYPIEKGRKGIMGYGDEEEIQEMIADHEETIKELLEKEQKRQGMEATPWHRSTAHQGIQA